MWSNNLVGILGNRLKFKPSMSDPDLWYRAMVDTEGSEYHTYILVFVDDVLILNVL